MARNEGQPPVFQLSSTHPDDAAFLTDALGFERLLYWSASDAQLSSSTLHTNGSFSLAVQDGGYLPIRSLPLALGPLESAVRRIAFDLHLPTQQPNPFWIGASQRFVTIPSANLFNAYLGQVELTPLPLGRFSKLSFDLPAAVRTALARARSDVRITIVLNVNQGSGTHYVDHLRFE